MARLPERVFRALLRLFPREFRGDFGEQMTADFQDQHKDRTERSRSSARLWLQTASDVLCRAPLEHLDILKRDAGYAVRLLKRRPGFTASALLTLTLGIGLNTAVYSVVSAVLWRDLEFPESDRLVQLFEIEATPDSEPEYVAPANFLDWQSDTHTLDTLTTTGSQTFTLHGDAGAERVTAMAVGVEFLPLVGARLALGRAFVQDDFEPVRAADGTARRPGSQGPRVIILGYELWKRQFAGRPDVIGQTVQLSGSSAEVVGVMERNPPFMSLQWAPWDVDDAWVPIEIDGIQRRARFMPVVGRLADGITSGQAQAEFDLIASRLAERYPESNKGWGVRVLPLRDTLVQGVRTQLLFLAGAVVVVLLVACANLTTLLLAHASGRRHELATRVSLGATRLHLVRQTLTESLVLSLTGGAFGVVLAFVAVPVLVASAPSDIPRLNEVTVNWTVLAVAASMSALVGVVCGLGACVALDRTSLLARRDATSRVTSEGRRFRQTLAAAEIGLALMLVIGAGLMVRTLSALGSIDVGFDPVNVMAVDVDVLEASDFRSGNRQATTARRLQLEGEILERVRSLPGVVSAGIGSGLMRGGGMGVMVTLPGGAGVDPKEIMLETDAVSPGYLESLGVRLLAGRVFDDADATRTPQAIIVTSSAARTLFGDRNPIGEITRINSRDVEVVGVVGDLRRAALETPPGAALYFHHAPNSGFTARSMVVKTEGDPLQLAEAVRAAVREVQPSLSRTRIDTIQQRIDTALAPRRFLLGLIGGFSLLALGLALVGIYGILAESVAQRVPEIGVRVALGATPGNVTRLFLRQGAWIIAIGLVLGLAGAFGLHRTMTTLVFGVETLDPPAFLAAIVCLIVTATLACAIPARRAARLDPVEALRQE